jgi:hypothetical protein
MIKDTFDALQALCAVYDEFVACKDELSIGEIQVCIVAESVLTKYGLFQDDGIEIDWFKLEELKQQL